MALDSSDERSSSASSSESIPAAAAAEQDRMVTEELEAAEALAHLAMRASKRVKSESPTRFSDQERTASHCAESPEKTSSIVPREVLMAELNHGDTSLKVDMEAKLSNTSLVNSTTGYLSHGCGKSRRNLTEEEKEERRIRRIFANRESARQTIRRRQALCEELTKKAADLASENDNLKQEMEMALNEYQMLETTNKELQDQVSKVVYAEAEELPTTSHKPACMHVTPSSASPLFLYNHPPFTPLFWPPPVSQSQNPVLSSHIPPSAVVMPSNIPFAVDSCEQESLINTNPPSTPFYIIPYPWFFPHPDHGVAIQSQPSDFQKNDLERSDSPTPHLFLPIEVKTEPSEPLEAPLTNDLNEPPEDFYQDGGDQLTSLASATTVKNENGLGLIPTHIETSSEFCDTPSAPEEKYSEPIMYSSTKSAEAAAAAAEARRKRRELTKLKNLHGRQCRMHC